MRLVEIRQIKRFKGFFYIDDYKIKADRIASDGYGVLCIFEPSKLDYDFKPILGPKSFAWFPTVESLKLIEKQLDLSDKLTCDWLREGKGWNKGPRPFPNIDMLHEILE
jgi:hypothetical protein